MAKRTPEYLKAYHAEYYRKNREKALEYQRQYREARREQIRLQAIEYRKRNPDARRKWRLANLARDKARDKAYKAAHAERIAEYKQRPDVKERMRLYSAEWTKANRDKQREYQQARRARLQGAFIERIDPVEVWTRHSGTCGICQEPVSLAEFHVDHIVPLARGGTHGYANTQPAHPTCNYRKGARLPEEMAA